MSNRKKYIIDRQYQLRTAFSIIGIVMVITACILGAITASVVYNNSRLSGNNSKIENIHLIENSIFERLSSRPDEVKDPLQREALIQSTRNHERNMDTLQNIITSNKNIIYSNWILLMALLIIVIAESAGLYVILIRKTHRVSGPIYVISNFMKEIIAGGTPNLRPLREKDELKEFYELFKNMVAVIHEREHKK